MRSLAPGKPVSVFMTAGIMQRLEAIEGVQPHQSTGVRIA